MDDISHQPNIDLYETDFYAWSLQQAALLGSGDFHAVDLVNLVEEIESLGRAQINALRSRYSVLCLHLLKLVVQPDRETRSWRVTIAEQRNQIRRLLKDSPSLKSKRETLFAEGYEDSLTVCAAQTSLAASSLPHEPPFTVDQAEDQAWRPDR